jgi:subtilase family serine protease
MIRRTIATRSSSSRGPLLALVAAALLVSGATSATAEDRNATAAELRAAASDDITFHVGLTRNERAANKALRKVSNPNSNSYRNFLSRKKIRKQYGAQPETIQALRNDVESYGLRLRMDRTGVFAGISGTAEQLSAWTGAEVEVQNVALPGGAAVFAYVLTPPDRITPLIREWSGIDVQAAFESTPISQQSQSPESFAGKNRGTPEGCLSEVGEQTSTYTYSYNQLRTAYGLDDIPSGRKVGRETRLLVIAQGDGFSDEALLASRKCFKLPAIQFTRSTLPGIEGEIPEGAEGDLDVQVAQAMLPKGSSVDVVQTVNVDPRSFLLYASAFDGAELPDAVTSSYGMCELSAAQDLGWLPGFEITASVATRLSLAGVSVFAAAGDSGSSDCVNQDTGEGDPQLAVDLPAATHAITAVGGSQLTVRKNNTLKKEWAWNDSGLLPPLGPSNLSGGGGQSIGISKPWWQKKAGTPGTTRSLPDVALHAGLSPGWPLWTAINSRLDVQPVGGTSAATPFLAAAVATMAGNEQRKGRPALGLVSPLLYSLGSGSASIRDITQGNNDLYDQGCCEAGKGYDLATGLGSPRLNRVYDNLPAPGVPKRAGNG